MLKIRNRKEKIRTWEKMKTKLKARFLPSSYVLDSYAQLHNLTQDHMSVNGYTREFEKLLIKCDIHEPEELMHGEAHLNVQRSTKVYGAKNKGL